ncbi:hypothetical protein E2C01_043206 [Portunus trituberculatus]|uniref:Uncharacterized protein n=1 Tax=Portunus trituberculatus TaxID=210409 RepID=A0A5B7FVG9_PORTR|nr:hypothetical protein [Portunus trituberculatus]
MIKCTLSAPSTATPVLLHPLPAQEERAVPRLSEAGGKLTRIFAPRLPLLTRTSHLQRATNTSRPPPVLDQLQIETRRQKASEARKSDGVKCEREGGRVRAGGNGVVISICRTEAAG